MPKRPYKYEWASKPENIGNFPPHGGFLIIPYVDEENASRIVSAIHDGAMTIYDGENWMELVISGLMSEFLSCEAIGNCLLSNQGFIDGLIQNLINNQTFLDGISNNAGLREIEANNQLSDSPIIEDLKSVTNDKDAVWSACFELSEYMLDMLKTLCFFLSALDGVTDIAQQLYSKDKRKRQQFDAEDDFGNPRKIGSDGEIVANPNGEWEFIPNILGQLVQTISESTMVSFLGNLAGIGADLILADINDTRQESISCVIFNEIVCDGETPLLSPYTFDNETFYDVGQSMLGNLDVGLAGNALALCMTITGIANSFVTVFPLNEVHRNYAIGLRSPSDEWQVICDTCEAPDCEALFVEAVAFGTTPIGAIFTSEYPIGTTPNVWFWQPFQRQEFSFGTNLFGQATIEYTPELLCGRNLKLTYSRRNTNTCTGFIDTFDTATGWTQRATNSISVNTVAGFIQTLTWNNVGLIEYEKIRFRIVSPFPNFISFNIL